MANMMEKMGEKLHLGGHKKDEPQQPPHGSAAGYGTDPAAAHTGPASTTAAPAGHDQHQGPMQNLKEKVKGKVHGEDGSSSSSSSESDGEGGRRRKVGGKKKHGLF